MKVKREKLLIYVNELKQLVCLNQRQKVALKELDRYEKLPAASAESGVIRNYIEWLVSIPWTEKTEDRIDIDLCRRNS